LFFGSILVFLAVLVDALRPAAAAAGRLEEAALNLLLGALDVLVGAVCAGAAAVAAVKEAALLGLAVLVEVDLLLEHPLGAANPLGLLRLGVRVVPGAEVRRLLLDHSGKADGRHRANDRGGLWNSQALALVARTLLGDPIVCPREVAPTDVGVFGQVELIGGAVLDGRHGAHRLGRVAGPGLGQAVADDRLGLDLDKGAEAVVARARRHFG